jgi:hypothetical protein
MLVPEKAEIDRFQVRQSGVIFARNNEHVIGSNLIDKPVILGYPPEPTSLVLMLQWLGLTYPNERGSKNVLDQLLDFLEYLSVRA